MVNKPSKFADKLSFYQNANTDNNSIKNNFVIRLNEFEIIIEAIKIKKDKDPVQHELILGRRGSGKSTLLKRIQIEIEENNSINRKYIGINLAEEQSGIYRLFDLWYTILEELIERLTLKETILKDFDEFQSNEDYTRYLFREINNVLIQRNLKVILLLDNFDRIVENFNDDGNLLRETLINHNNIQIIAASTRMSEHFWRYDKPFYEFFRKHRLESLSTDEMIGLINHWSESLNYEKLKTFAKNNIGKIEAIRILTDGLPRTLQFFIEILLDNDYLYGYEYLKKIMDKVTPVYQERINNLTPQLRKIVAEMAFIWRATSTKELVEYCKMESKLISANLKTLVEKGVVSKIETGKKNHLYRISERFFNMWFIVTQGNPSQKRKAKWLSIFLEHWYDEKDFKKIAITHIKNLKENKFSYDQALPISKAISQCKYTSTKQRDTIIDLVDGLNKTGKDSLIHLPKKYGEIASEIDRLSDMGQIDKAIELANDIENEEDGVKFAILGSLYFSKKDYSSAKKHFINAVKKGRYDFLNELGFILFQEEDYVEAEKYTQILLEQNDPSANFNLGLINANLNKLDLANKYFEKAIPDHTGEAYFNLGQIQFLQNNYDLAEDYYIKAIKHGHPRVSLYLGVLYSEMDKLEKAEKQFLIAIKHGNSRANLYLGVLYMETERLNKAEKYLLAAFETREKFSSIILASYYEDLEKYDAAIKYYNIAIEQKYEDSWFNLALLYDDLGDLENAKKYYLLSIENNYFKAANNLGILYEMENRLDEAEKYYLLGVENNIENALFNLSDFYYSLNIKKEQSLNLISKYLSDSNDSSKEKFQIIVEIWNGKFDNLKERILDVVRQYGTGDLEYWLEMLLIHLQINLVYDLFNNNQFGEEMKNRYAVIYYATLILLNNETSKELLEIPPEIRETVISVVDEIKSKQEFYEYR